MTHFGQHIREQRGRRGLRQVAREIGISPATLSRAERGEGCDGETLARIVLWSGVSVKWMLREYLRDHGAPIPEIDFAI